MHRIESEKVSEIKYLLRKELRTGFYIAGCLLTLGLLWIIFRWFPQWESSLYAEAPDIDQASHLLVLKTDNSQKIVSLKRKKVRQLPSSEPKDTVYIFFQNRMYYLDTEANVFKLGSSLMTNHLRNNKDAIIESRGCLSMEDAAELRAFYGNNHILLSTRSYISFCLHEFSQPMIIWQMFSMTIFFIIGYKVYGGLMIAIIIYSSLLLSYGKMMSHEKIRVIAEDTCEVRCLRRINGAVTEITISSQDLVIGDVVRIQRNDVFTVDMVMLNGSCIVSEAVITGESNPVRKAGVIGESGDVESDFQEPNVIHCGSKCLMNKTPKVEALVIRTGWSTSKGELISDVIHSKPVEFKFKEEVNTVLLYLFFSGLIFCFFLFLLMFRSRNFNSRQFVFKCLEIMMLVLPTALVISFTMGIQEATKKLQEGNVLPVTIDKINEAGRVKFVCFDKTGTLTEVSVSIAGYAVNLGEDYEIVQDLNELDRTQWRVKVQECLAACHSLQIVDGQIGGDPLDEEMFKKSEFTMEEVDSAGLVRRFLTPPKRYRAKGKLDADYKLEVLATNEFSPERKRMSVVISDNKTGLLRALIKGAPEKIKQLAAQSSIPSNYDDLVNEYSQKGYRTIAFGYQNLTVADHTTVSVEQVENDFEFIGFLLLSNQVKPETKPVIDQLKAVEIECKMITGDNIYTALNVACAAGLVEESENVFIGVYNPKTDQIRYRFLSYNEMKQNDLKMQLEASVIPPSTRRADTLSHREFKPKYASQSIMEVLLKCKESKNTKIAVEGAVYEREIVNLNNLDPTYVDTFLKYTVIFARSNPKHKESIVERIKRTEICQKSTYTVAFVGDGSNDSKALRVANIGLSLGSNESSIASSFNTQIMNIQPLVKVLIEGRASLDLGVQTFKFIMIAGLFQFFAIDALSVYRYDFNSLHYLLSDFLAIAVPGMLMARTKSIDRLNKNLPRVSILNRQFYWSLFSQLMIYLTLLIFCAQMIMNSRFSKSLEEILGDQSFVFFDDYRFAQGLLMAVFLNLSILGLCIATNNGYPFREPFYTNIALVCYFIVAFVLHIALICEPEIDSPTWTWITFKYLNLTDLKNGLRDRVLLLSLLSGAMCFVVERLVMTYFLIKKRVLNEIVRRERAKEELTQSMLEDRSYIFKALSQN